MRNFPRFSAQNSRLRFVLGWIGFAAVIAMAMPLHAGVNMKNGNFYITYTDVVFPNSEFEISRTYNSKSSKSLSFGVGWGTRYETSLSVTGVGSVSLIEHGSGAQRSYHPSELSADDVEKLTEEVLAAMEGEGWLKSDDEAQRLRSRFGGDVDLLTSVYKNLVDSGLLPPKDIAIGQRLTSTQTVNAEVIREPVGFYRRGESGHERFSLDGRIVEKFDRYGVGYRLKRNVDGHFREILFSDGNSLLVETNASGWITRLKMEGGEAVYTYDAEGNLVQATNMAGGTYGYEYDENHNMRFIRYADGSSFEIGYHEGTQFVAYTVARDGTYVTYDYGDYEITEPGIESHYYTTKTEYRSVGSEMPLSEETVSYKEGINKYGGKYTAGYTRTIDGVTTETRYHPCGMPTLKRRGNMASEFDYDDQCRLIRKKTANEEVHLEYDPRSQKISRIRDMDLRRKQELVSDFQYDIKGNLIFAQNSKGGSASLSYNAEGQIIRLTDQHDRVLTFTYGEIGKPTRIEIEGVGAIDVSYGANGEIDNVNSAQGHEAALRVTQSFQSLLALVKPAGVDFNL